MFSKVKLRVFKSDETNYIKFLKYGSFFKKISINFLQPRKVVCIRGWKRYVTNSRDDTSGDLNWRPFDRKIKPRFLQLAGFIRKMATAYIMQKSCIIIYSKINNLFFLKILSVFTSEKSWQIYKQKNSWL